MLLGVDDGSRHAASAAPRRRHGDRRSSERARPLRAVATATLDALARAAAPGRGTFTSVTSTSSPVTVPRGRERDGRDRRAARTATWAARTCATIPALPPRRPRSARSTGASRSSASDPPPRTREGVCGPSDRSLTWRGRRPTSATEVRRRGERHRCHHADPGHRGPGPSGRVHRPLSARPSQQQPERRPPLTEPISASARPPSRTAIAHEPGRCRSANSSAGRSRRALPRKRARRPGRTGPWSGASRRSSGCAPTR